MSLPPTLAGEAEPLPRSVLAITQSSPSSGGAIALFQALRSDPIINSTSRVGVYTEHLDLNRFPSSQYRLQTRNYLRKKYRDTRIGVVIVDGPIGLDLVLSWRAEMWPEVPVVFYGLDELSAAQQKLSPNVTGIVAQQTFQGMVNTARVLVPGFKRVALVGDPPGRDTYRLNYGPDVAALAAEVELIDLTGMAVTEVRKRVAVLPNDAVVFYTSIFVDGAGVVHTPQSALLAISGATSRPIITDVESNLGYGAVGGFLFSIESAARETVRLASRILDGENISQIPVTKIDLNKPMFDWRETQAVEHPREQTASGKQYPLSITEHVGSVSLAGQRGHGSPISPNRFDIRLVLRAPQAPLGASGINATSQPTRSYESDSHRRRTLGLDCARS